MSHVLLFIFLKFAYTSTNVLGLHLLC